jgi:hypothetical protein
VIEILDRAPAMAIVSLDHTIVTHYDNHLGGMDEVLAGASYPEVRALDRGNSLLPRLDRDYVENICVFDAEEIEALAPWIDPARAFCPNRASCAIVR